MRDIAAFAGQEFAYLTTRGRRTGRRHRIEIWFAVRDDVVYLLSGGADRSDWVRNLRRLPEATLRVGDVARAVRARIVADGDEEAAARRLLAAKYQGWRDGQPLSRWAATALVVALDPREA